MSPASLCVNSAASASKQSLFYPSLCKTLDFTLFFRYNPLYKLVITNLNLCQNRKLRAISAHGKETIRWSPFTILMKHSVLRFLWGEADGCRERNMLYLSRQKLIYPVLGRSPRLLRGCGRFYAARRCDFPLPDSPAIPWHRLP